MTTVQTLLNDPDTGGFGALDVPVHHQLDVGPDQGQRPLHGYPTNAMVDRAKFGLGWNRLGMAGKTTTVIAEAVFVRAP